MHYFSPHIVLLERWAARRKWGLVGPRTFRAILAPAAGWLQGQWEQACSAYRTEVAAANWGAAKQARDDYAATHGGYNSSGFAIPGEVAAAARGER